MKKKKKNVRDPEVCSGFSLRGRRVVELNVLGEALDGGCEACGTALRLSNCINETVTGLDCYFTYVVQTPSMERRIFVEQILRPTVAPEPREGEQSLMSTRRLLLNSHFHIQSLIVEQFQGN